MKNGSGAVLAAVIGGLAATMTSQAQVVNVEVTGIVERNDFINGTYFGVPAGAPVKMKFSVDASNWMDDTTFPVRGYPITPGTFSLTCGTASAGLRTGLPAGFIPMFVLRNNDPAVDGVYLTHHIQMDFPVPMDLGVGPGLSSAGIEFSDTFSGNTFASRDILGALGEYPLGSHSDCNGCLVYNFGVSAGGGLPLILEFQTFRIWRPCGLADISGLGGVPGADGSLTADDLVYYLAQFFAGDVATADLVGLGGSPGADGQITVDDIVAFLGAFFAGCP